MASDLNIESMLIVQNLHVKLRFAKSHMIIVLLTPYNNESRKMEMSGLLQVNMSLA